MYKYLSITRRMLVLFASAFLVASLFPYESQAGPPDHVQPDPSEVIERLGLSEDQVPEVEALFAELSDRRQAIRDQYGSEGRPDRSQMRAMRGEMQALRDEFDPRFAEILNDNQMDELKAFREEQRSQMRDKMRRHRDSQ